MMRSISDKYIFRNVQLAHLLVVFFVSAFAVVYGRAYAADVEMVYKSLGVNRGLSNNVVRDIAQDKFGCVWIATDEGINRVSGIRVTQNFKSGMVRDWLSGNELNSLADDPSEPVMWIGTQRSGLISYNYDTGEYRIFRSFDEGEDVISTDDVTDLVFNSRGELLIATFWHGVDCLDPKTGRFTHYNMETVEGMTNNQVMCVATGGDDILYLGHERGGFSIIDMKRMKSRHFSTEDGLAGNSIHSILVEENNVWLGTDKGLCLYKSNTGEFVRFDLGEYDTLCSGIMDVNGKLWLAMEYHGVVEFDREDQTFSQITPNYFDGMVGDIALSGCSASVLFEDMFENIWVGTFRNGVILLSPETGGFSIDDHFFNEKDRYRYNFVADVMSLAVADGHVYCGTNGTGLISDDPVEMDLRRKFPEYIQTLTVDDEGVIWCGDNEGKLIRYNPREGSIMTFDFDVEPEGIKDLFADRDVIWAGTNKGLIKFDRGKCEITGWFDVGNNFVRKIEKDSYGHLLVGTFGEGLRVMDAEMNEIAYLTVNSGFPSNTVNDICVDHHKVWVATSEGLVAINAKDYEDFEVISHPYRNICSVIQDKGGNVWFSTLTGIGVVRRDGSETLYTHLPSLPFNTNSVASSDKGRLYFGTTSGTVTFMPDVVLDEHNVPLPVISEMIIHMDEGEGRSNIVNLMGKRSVTLNYSENSFTIFVSPLNYFARNVDLECRLSGFEDIWYDLNHTEEMTFRNLPYGTYEFQVRQKSHTLSHINETVRLKIEIKPPFWLSWWAKLIYLVLAGIMIWYVARLYTRHLRKKSDLILERRKQSTREELNEERLKFFTNITHELRTPLTLIMGPLEDIYHSNSLNDVEKRKISMIHKSARRLLELVNQILDFRKTETQNKRLCVGKGNVVETVYEVALKYKELQRKESVEVAIEADPEKIVMYYDKEVITTVIDNLMSNALKYTDKGRVTLSVGEKDVEGRKMVCISVADTGYGISQESMPHIFDRYYQEKGKHQASGTGIGLALVKALVTLHQGVIEVDSKRNIGTTFTVMFDKENVYPEALHADDEAKGEECHPVDEEIKSDHLDVENERLIVLVVEDNPDIIEYVKDYLSDMFDVRTATNGKEGLAVARTVLPDVIVTDIMMPVMDGIEMCRILKNDVATSHIPVIMLTAKDSVNDREQGYNIGAESYLTKPFSSSLLVSRINNLISRRDDIARYYAAVYDNRKVNQDSGARLPEKAKDRTEPDAESKARQLSSAMNQIDREFLDKIEKIITDNLSAETLDIDYVAGAMCMSRATLYRKMKAVAGMSTNDYIRKIRIEAAEALMLEGNLPISEIAFRVGYESPSYFRKSFKAVYGMNPTEYVKWLKTRKEE